MYLLFQLHAFTNLLHRKDMTFHCCCRSFYDPVQDVQRYCERCKKWFNIGCCKSIAGAVHRPPGLKEKLHDMPIMRGALGSMNKEWRISGNGWHREMVRDWRRANRFPDNWEDQLGGDFITTFEYASFTYYHCPSGCEGGI